MPGLTNKNECIFLPEVFTHSYNILPDFKKYLYVRMKIEHTTKKMKAAFKPLKGRKSRDNQKDITNGFRDLKSFEIEPVPCNLSPVI